MPDFATYQAAYIRAFTKATFTRELKVVESATSVGGISRARAHMMQQPRVWGGFLVTTSGLSHRAAQSACFELLAHTDDGSDKVPEALLDVAAALTRPLKLRPGDRLHLPQLEHGPSHVVVSPSGFLNVLGRQIDLLSIIPVTERETEVIARGNVFDWLEVHAASIVKTTELLSRWRSVRAPSKGPSSWRCAAQVLDHCPEPNPDSQDRGRSPSWASKY